MTDSSSKRLKSRSSGTLSGIFSYDPTLRAWYGDIEIQPLRGWWKISSKLNYSQI